MVSTKSGGDIADADLMAARDAGIISQQTYEELRDFLLPRLAAAAAEPAVRFDLTHVLWYAGALVVMAAMGLFTTEAFNRMGGWALTATGVGYGIAFLAVGRFLWLAKGLRTPAGLAVAVAVSMVPLAIYGVQDALDLWQYAKGDPGHYREFFPRIHGSWLYMEIATVIAAAAAIRLFPFPFIVMPAAVALWFMSMDVAVWVKPLVSDEFHLRRIVSIWFGLALIAAAWVLDVRRRGADFGFWPHLAGATALWGGLSLGWDSTGLEKFLYCLLNVGLVLFSVFMRRRIYAVYGMMGVAGYLGYLAGKVFADLILFSFALSAIGLGVIYLGIVYHRRREALEARLQAALPAALRGMRPSAG